MKTSEQKFGYLYVCPSETGRPSIESIMGKDVAEYTDACVRQRIYGTLTEPAHVTALDGRVVPINNAMYADELLRQLETAVKHIENLQAKYQPEIPFAVGGYKFVIALAKGEKVLEPVS